MKLRPLTGRFAIDTSLMVELIWERVVSTDGVLALIGTRTVTDSETFAGHAFFPFLGFYPGFLKGWKTPKAAVTVYGPRGRRGHGAAPPTRGTP